MRSRTELTRPVRVRVEGWAVLPEGVGYDGPESVARPFPLDLDYARLLRTATPDVVWDDVTVMTDREAKVRALEKIEVERAAMNHERREYLNRRLETVGRAGRAGRIRERLMRRWLG